MELLLTESWDGVGADVLRVLGESHHLFPLWYSQRTALWKDPVCRKAYKTQWLLNALATETVCRLVDDLESAGVEVVVLKGLPLAQRIFGDLAARTSGDIDLLVRPCQYSLALETLQGNGPSSRAALLARWAFFRKQTHAFSIDSRGTQVDLHHCLRLEVSGGQQQARFWNNREHVTLGRREVPVPSLYDTLALLILGFHEDLAQGTARVRSALDIKATWRSLDAQHAWSYLRDLKLDSKARAVNRVLNDCGARLPLPVQTAEKLSFNPWFCENPLTRRLWALKTCDSPSRALYRFLVGLPWRLLIHRL